MRPRRAELPLRIDGLAAARTFFAGCLAECDPARESLWVAHLDDEARCLHLSHHAGGRRSAELPIRTILADAMHHGSAAILLAHNHPSGDCRPSDNDRRATKRLACAADAIDCALVDHLVFGGGNCTSFRAVGLL